MTKQIKKKTYKRKFNPRLVESNTSYYISEVTQLFNIGETSVRYWLKNGLKIIDGKTPTMIHCEDLREFLANKQKTNEKKCLIEEMFCFKCRQPKKVFDNQVTVINKNNKILHLKGGCETCKSFMTKKYSFSKLNEIKQFFALNVNYNINT